MQQLEQDEQEQQRQQQWTQQKFVQEEDKALQSTEGPHPDGRMAWRRLRTALEHLKSNIKAQTLPRDPFCQHSGVGRQSTNIYFRFNGCYHWGRPWAYMDCCRHREIE